MTHWGIIGLGNIAHHFVKDLALVPSALLYAVASRSEEKAKEFAQDYSAVQYYSNYEALLEDPKVEVVYIATPHSSHAHWSLAAIKAGKHVLCEKPLGMNLAEVVKITQAAQDNKVFLMEALWTRFNPSIQEIVTKIKENTIGDIQYIQADFGFYAMDKAPTSRVLDASLGGGSLLDIGIYPIFLAYLMLGMPKNIMASATYSEHGTEIQTAMIFEYERAKAVLYSGFTSKSSMVAQISGSDGLITIDSRWHETQGYSLEKEGAIESYLNPTTGRGYAHEIAAVQQSIENGTLEQPEWTHKNSIDLASLLDQVQRLTKATLH